MILMKQYKRIHKKINFAGVREFWMLGDDHFLIIKNNGYTENYRRFFYSDIQWIKTSAVKFSIVITVILSLFFLLLLAVTIACYLGKESSTARVFEIITCLWALIAVVHYLVGPAGTITIKTFSGKETLKVNRFRKALKIVAKLKDRVLTAQGMIPEKELVEKLAERESSGTPELCI